MPAMPDSFDVSRLLFSCNSLPGVYYVIFQRWSKAFPTDKREVLQDSGFIGNKMQLGFFFLWQAVRGQLSNQEKQWQENGRLAQLFYNTDSFTDAHLATDFKLLL